MAAVMERRDGNSMQRQTCSSFVKASQRRPFLLSSHIQPGKFCSPSATATPLTAKEKQLHQLSTAVLDFEWVLYFAHSHSPEVAAAKEDPVTEFKVLVFLGEGSQNVRMSTQNARLTPCCWHLSTSALRSAKAFSAATLVFCQSLRILVCRQSNT